MLKKPLYTTMDLYICNIFTFNFITIQTSITTRNEEEGNDLQ